MKQKEQSVPYQIFSIEENRWFNGVSPSARKHLLNSMKSLDAGRAPTPSFKLYGKSDVSVVDDFFAAVKASGLFVPKWQLEYEMSRKKKFGPQGGYAPWSELKPEFELYYTRPQRISVPIRSDRIRIYEELNCRVRSYTDTLTLLKNDDKIQDRASGWRTFNLKKTSTVAQNEALKDVHSGRWQDGYMYVFSRFNKQKKRLFFPAPYSSMILEAQYFYPFLKAIQESLLHYLAQSPFTFWADKIGFDKMFRDIVSIKCQGYDPTHFVYVQRDFYHMDTSQGFDQTRSSYLLKVRAAFGMSKAEFDRYSKVLEFGATCPVFTPSGVYTGYRGKASGENTTNGDETCSNEDYDDTLQDKIRDRCARVGIRYKLVYTGGNGDDGMSIYYLFNMKDLSRFKAIVQDCAEQTAKEFGYTINDKWHISDEYGLYCQRMISWDDESHRIIDRYPATLILNSIINPEHEYSKSEWDKDYRDLDIIEKLDNGKNLQYFHQLVDFVDNGMKFRLLGRSENETRRILLKYDRYRALREDPFNYQDAQILDDISKSPTVQYLLSKRGIQLGR